MFALKLLIAFPEQIDEIKADLTKYLPNIKSSHRVEALARALGFKTYAALRAADYYWLGGIIAEVNWSAFNEYLKEKGFHATAKPLYLAIGRASIRLSMGMHDYQLVARQVHLERSKRADGNILSDSSVEEFLRAYSFLSRIPATRTITKKRNAYNLKHIAENVSLVYPDGEVSQPSYVATGSLVLAAIGAGFWFRPLDGSGELQHLHFNMLQSAIDDLDCEIRPDSSTARKRKRIPNQNRLGGVSGTKCYEYDFETFEPESKERDFGLEFRCLGYNNGLYYYLSYARTSIVALTASGHTLKNLTKLDTLEAWKASSIWPKLGTHKRVPLQTLSTLIETCSKRGLFSPDEQIKELGRWKAA